MIEHLDQSADSRCDLVSDRSDLLERIQERFFRAGWTLHNDDVIESRPGTVENLIFRR